MGAGSTLREAIAELKALPEDARECLLALPLLLRLRLEVPIEPARQTQEDEEFMTSTQDIVEKYLADQGRSRHEHLGGRRTRLDRQVVATGAAGRADRGGHDEDDRDPLARAQVLTEEDEPGQRGHRRLE